MPRCSTESNITPLVDSKVSSWISAVNVQKSVSNESLCKYFMDYLMTTPISLDDKTISLSFDNSFKSLYSGFVIKDKYDFDIIDDEFLFLVKKLSAVPGIVNIVVHKTEEEKLVSVHVYSRDYMDDSMKISRCILEVNTAKETKSTFSMIPFAADEFDEMFSEYKRLKDNYVIFSRG